MEPVVTRAAGVQLRGASRRRRLIALGLAIGFAWCAGWPADSARAQDEPSLERAVKAAYLYQFATYVDWPPQAFARPDTPLTIAVIGADPLAEALQAVTSGRQVHGRAVVVRKLAADDALEGVHILFLGRAESTRLEAIARRAWSGAVLAVTEWEGAIEQGSMINFVMIDRRVRFEVGLGSVEKGGLKVSSRLLAVAEQVRRERF